MKVTRKLYDVEYYQKSCEGFNNSTNDLSKRLAGMLELITPQISGVITDIGFGRGELSIRMARLPNVTKIYSLDYSPAATTLFMENLKNEPDDVLDKLVVITADITELLKLNIEFDYALLCDVVEHIHIDQLKTYINELSKKVQRKIFICTPISKAEPNERHVWLAKSPQEVFDILPTWNHKFVGYSGVGEDYYFEFINPLIDSGDK